MTDLFNSMGNTCGCGKPVRYITLCGKGSCNKYTRCATYEELSPANASLRLLESKYYLVLKKIVDTAASDYECRAWAKEAIKDD